MKGSKTSAVFINKFSTFLSKFKESSTISIAHEQIRKLFSQYKFSDIGLSFASKMDSCDQLTDKEKKEYIKIYLSLIDVYGQDIVLEHYQRIIQSLAKKGLGVSQVVGHLCRTLLKRIYPTENIANYILHLIDSFQKHPEIGKILKQIVQSFDSQIVAPFQSQIMGLINDKIQNAKSQMKIQLLEATLAIILSLESKFCEEICVQGFVVKNFKNQDWNVRKLCVDITYALLVIRNQANKLLNQAVNQLKYDKIKHVRDSVGNYTNLYKQIYGQQKQKQAQKNESNKKQRPNALDKKRTMTNKSPIVMVSRHQEPQPEKSQKKEKSANKSLEKSIKNASRNQEFFQNAANRDVIRVSESKSLVFTDKPIIKDDKIQPKAGFKELIPNFSQKFIAEKDDREVPSNSQNQDNQNSINFERYLKSRTETDGYLTYSPSEQKQHILINNRIQLAESPSPQRPSILPQPQPQQSPPHPHNHDSIPTPPYIQANRPSPSLSLPSPSPSPCPTTLSLQSQVQLLQKQITKLSGQMFSRMRNLEHRVSVLEESRYRSSFDASQISLASLQKEVRDIRYELANQDKYFQQSFEHKFYERKEATKGGMINKKDEESEDSYYLKNSATENNRNKPIPDNPHRSQQDLHPRQQNYIQSNLYQKIQVSINQNNWNQAFSLALANNSRQYLLQVLRHQQTPKDKLVQECLLVQLRRNLSSCTVLRWLANFLQDHTMPKDKLVKFVKELEKCQYVLEKGDGGDAGRNFAMLRMVIINQLKAKIGGGVDSFLG